MRFLFAGPIELELSTADSVMLLLFIAFVTIVPLILFVMTLVGLFGSKRRTFRIGLFGLCFYALIFAYYVMREVAH